jgi:hypothetical protein
LSTSDPGGRLRFAAAKPQHLRRYRFAMKTADFLLCGNCGVYIGALIEAGPGRFGIINTRALRAIPEELRDADPVSYDEEQKPGRISRREARWTPVAVTSSKGLKYETRDPS